jgi:hypothetical protein
MDIIQILDSGFRRNDNKALPLFVTPAKAGVQRRVIQGHFIVYSMIDPLVTSGVCKVKRQIY